jgi:hypothetical protein
MYIYCVYFCTYVCVCARKYLRTYISMYVSMFVHYTPAAFTPENIPGTHFCYRLSLPPMSQCQDNQVLLICRLLSCLIAEIFAVL